MEQCVFCKIAKGEIHKDFEYQDEDIMVFKDISPIRPVHHLIVPKKHVKEIAVADPKLVQKLFSVVQKMILQTKLENKGYRLTLNGGGAQVIDHLHIHLTGPMGKKAGWLY